MFGAAAIALAQTAGAQTGLPPVGQWQSHRGEYRCTLSREFGQNASVSLGIRMAPGDESADLIVVNQAWATGGDLPNRVEIVLYPSAARFPAAARSGRVPSEQHRFMRISAVDHSFFEAFSGATRMSIEGRRRELLTLKLTETDSGLRALRECHNDLLRSWGVDPTVTTSLRRRPVPIGETAALMASSEPEQSQDSFYAFFVIIRFTVRTDGRIGTCDVVRSGGYPEAAELLCTQARRRARYEPAIGADGQPVAVQLIQTTNLRRGPG